MILEEYIQDKSAHPVYRSTAGTLTAGENKNQGSHGYTRVSFRE